MFGPTGLPDVDSQWLLTFSDKKLLYGPMRTAIGGETANLDKTGAKRRRCDSDFEPVAYHSMLPEVFQELLSSYPCKGVIDFSPMPDLPLACLKAGVPYVGLCYTQEHVTLLQDYLAHKVFSWMLEEGSEFYEAALAKIVAPKTQMTDGADDGEEKVLVRDGVRSPFLE